MQALREVRLCLLEYNPLQHTGCIFSFSLLRECRAFLLHFLLPLFPFYFFPFPCFLCPMHTKPSFPQLMGYISPTSQCLMAQRDCACIPRQNPCSCRMKAFSQVRNNHAPCYLYGLSCCCKAREQYAAVLSRTYSP